MSSTAIGLSPQDVVEMWSRCGQVVVKSYGQQYGHGNKSDAWFGGACGYFLTDSGSLTLVNAYFVAIGMK
ncbi:MAG: hypothetical protein ACJATP_003387 [Candidatus Azotimanducaceae bacterium]|jgi:hypothetical protein